MFYRVCNYPSTISIHQSIIYGKYVSYIDSSEDKQNITIDELNDQITLLLCLSSQNYVSFVIKKESIDEINKLLHSYKIMFINTIKPFYYFPLSFPYFIDFEYYQSVKHLYPSFNIETGSFFIKKLNNLEIILQDYNDIIKIIPKSHSDTELYLLNNNTDNYIHKSKLHQFIEDYICKYMYYISPIQITNYYIDVTMSIDTIIEMKEKYNRELSFKQKLKDELFLEV
jgi:hypothetical protein